MNILIKIKSFLSIKILSPYLVFSFYFLRLLRTELNFNIIELIITWSSICFLIAVIIYLVKHFLTRKLYSFSVGLTISLFIFLFIGLLLSTFKKMLFNIDEKYLLVGFLIILVFALIHIFKRNEPLYKLNYFLNLIFSLFILIECFNIFNVFSKINVSEKQSIIESKKLTNSPNVYIIIIDGYANNTSLKKYWNFDNSKFTNFLGNKGFEVIKNSKTNYMYTLETMASMLNFNYIPEYKTNFVGLVEALAVDNLLMKTFQKNGYSINNLSLINYQNSNFSLEPELYSYKKAKSISNAILIDLKIKIRNSYTILKRFFPKFKPKINHDFFHKRDIIICNKLDSIIQLKQKKKLTIFHYMGLHPPFINKKLNSSKSTIDSFLLHKNNINRLSLKQLDTLFMNSYINQITKTNQVFTEKVTNIIAHDKNSIVVILGDHGFRYMIGYPKNEAIKESFSNFCAILLPDNQYEPIYESISPINLMRFISNKAMGTKFSSLAERQILPNTLITKKK